MDLYNGNGQEPEPCTGMARSKLHLLSRVLHLHFICTYTVALAPGDRKVMGLRQPGDWPPATSREITTEQQ